MALCDRDQDIHWFAGPVSYELNGSAFTPQPSSVQYSIVNANYISVWCGFGRLIVLLAGVASYCNGIAFSMTQTRLGVGEAVILCTI